MPQQLVEGGFLKRVDQRDLVRMAGLALSDKGKAAAKGKDKGEGDETIRKQNCVALAISELQRTAGSPNRRLRPTAQIWHSALGLFT